MVMAVGRPAVRAVSAALHHAPAAAAEPCRQGCGGFGEGRAGGQLLGFNVVEQQPVAVAQPAVDLMTQRVAPALGRPAGIDGKGKPALAERGEQLRIVGQQPGTEKGAAEQHDIALASGGRQLVQHIPGGQAGNVSVVAEERALFVGMGDRHRQRGFTGILRPARAIAGKLCRQPRGKRVVALTADRAVRQLHGGGGQRAVAGRAAGPQSAVLEHHLSPLRGPVGQGSHH